MTVSHNLRVGVFSVTMVLLSVDKMISLSSLTRHLFWTFVFYDTYLGWQEVASSCPPSPTVWKSFLYRYLLITKFFVPCCPFWSLFSLLKPQNLPCVRPHTTLSSLLLVDISRLEKAATCRAACCCQRGDGCQGERVVECCLAVCLLLLFIQLLKTS